MDHRREARVGFVVAGGDAAESLDFAEEVLDQMAPLVPLDVAGNVGGPVALWRDHRHRAAVVQIGAQGVAIKSLVRQQGGEVEILRGATPTLSGRCPGSTTKRTRLPSASTRATILVVKPPRERPMACAWVPPRAAVPCWCTRTMVPSMITDSKSASCAKTWKILSNTPLLAQRWKLWKTEFQFPKPAG